jgi:hypothetical protein
MEKQRSRDSNGTSRPSKSAVVATRGSTAAVIRDLTNYRRFELTFLMWPISYRFDEV